MKTENRHNNKEINEIKKIVICNLLQKMINDNDEIMVELNNRWAEQNRRCDFIYRTLDVYNLVENFDKEHLAKLLLEGNFNNKAEYYRIDDNREIHTDWGEVVKADEIVEELLTFGVPDEAECCEFSNETLADELRPHLVQYLNIMFKLGISLKESVDVLDNESVLFDDWSDDDFILCLTDSLEEYRSEL